MKAKYFVTIVFILLSLAAYLVLMSANLQLARSRTVALLALLPHDLGAFYKHNARLPDNWVEFIDFSKKQYNHKWNLYELEPRYTLKWGWHVSEWDVKAFESGKPPVILFTVLDSDLKNIEARVNEGIYCCCYAADTYPNYNPY
ncbi:MAG TPA: hypothetical protein VK970_23665 [Candidatus Methylacidiphilales bacterium]|nr:hypothetical protein [Candidatus Methylacidiphilales bacterium]